MAKTRQEEIKELIQTCNRRLHGLKLKKAQLGTSADVSLDVEIEDIETQLDNLKNELEALREVSPPQPRDFETQRDIETGPPRKSGLENIKLSGRPVKGLVIVFALCIVAGLVWYGGRMANDRNNPATATSVAGISPSPATRTAGSSPINPSSNKRIELNQTVTGKLIYNEGNTWLFSDGPATIDISLDVGPRGDGLIIVTGPDGNQLDYVDAQAGGQEQLLNFLIPDDNNYTIFVRNTQNSPADYTLTVASAESAETIKLGETVTGKLIYNEGNTWLFSDGPATIDISLDVGPRGDGLIIVTGPDGNQLDYVDAQAGGQEQLLNFLIPDDNNYIIFVRNTQNSPADYTLTVASAESAETIKLGETVTGKLIYNEGNTWLFSDGPATIDISLDVGPRGDGLIIVTGPNGNQLDYVDAQAGGQEQLLNFLIPDDKIYTILVRNTQNSPADYTLRVVPADALD